MLPISTKSVSAILWVVVISLTVVGASTFSSATVVARVVVVLVVAVVVGVAVEVDPPTAEISLDSSVVIFNSVRLPFAVKSFVMVSLVVAAPTAITNVKMQIFHIFLALNFPLGIFLTRFRNFYFDFSWLLLFL